MLKLIGSCMVRIVFALPPICTKALQVDPYVMSMHAN